MRIVDCGFRIENHRRSVCSSFRNPQSHHAIAFKFSAASFNFCTPILVYNSSSRK